MVRSLSYSFVYENLRGSDIPVHVPLHALAKLNIPIGRTAGLGVPNLLLTSGGARDLTHI